jgi:hypothetical protein
MTKVDKITIDGSVSYDGYDRYVEGYYNVDDNNVYKFELETDDGFTSIHLIDGDAFINLEEEDDCEQFGLTEDDGIEIYDEILDFVNDNGYDFIGEEFE